MPARLSMNTVTAVSVFAIKLAIVVQSNIRKSTLSLFEHKMIDRNVLGTYLLNYYKSPKFWNK